MFIGKENANWVSECKYLGLKICNGKYLHKTREDKKREACYCANSIILYKYLSEECMVYL